MVWIFLGVSQIWAPFRNHSWGSRSPQGFPRPIPDHFRHFHLAFRKVSLGRSLASKKGWKDGTWGSMVDNHAGIVLLVLRINGLYIYITPIMRLGYILDTYVKSTNYRYDHFHGVTPVVNASTVLEEYMAQVSTPWKSKTKQRMAFRMIQIKDSPLPMGKVWFLDSLGTYWFILTLY